MAKITIVTFHSEGPPHDEGLSLEPQAATLRHIAEELGVGFEAYTPRRLRELGAGAVVRSYPESFKLELNPGYHKIGFGAWKPFIILHELSKRNEGDIVFYMDANIIKYPGLRDKVLSVREMVATALENCDFFIGRENVKSAATRAGQFSSMAQLSMIGRGTMFAENFPILLANNIIARKTESACAIVLDWLALCMVDGLITPPQTPEERTAGYKWFCAEQMVLNYILARHIEEGELPWYYPNLFYGRGNIPVVPENLHVAWLAGSPRVEARTPKLRQQFALEIKRARAFLSSLPTSNASADSPDAGVEMTSPDGGNGPWSRHLDAMAPMQL
jgi:hypothetical protein